MSENTRQAVGICAFTIMVLCVLLTVGVICYFDTDSKARIKEAEARIKEAEVKKQK